MYFVSVLWAAFKHVKAEKCNSFKAGSVLSLWNEGIVTYNGVQAAMSKAATELERRVWQGQEKMFQCFLIILKLPWSGFSICLLAVNI